MRDQSIDRRKIRFEMSPTRRRVLLSLCGSFMTIDSASAGTQQQEGAEYFSHLKRAFEQSTKIVVFKFTQPCVRCRERDLVLADLSDQPRSSSSVMPKNTVAAVREALLLPGSYVFGAFKAMPFFPDYGIEFVKERPVATLLLSSSYRGAHLVLARRIPAQSARVNIRDEVFAAILNHLGEVLRQ